MGYKQKCAVTTEPVAEMDGSETTHIKGIVHFVVAPPLEAGVMTSFKKENALSVDIRDWEGPDSVHDRCCATASCF